jgi:hypothetical protein
MNIDSWWRSLARMSLRNSLLNIYPFGMEREDRQTREQPVFLGRRRGPIIRR